MWKWFKLGFMGVATVCATIFYFNLVTFAEGDVICSGMFHGETSLLNPDAGVTYFDDVAVDLSIMLGTGVTGTAPSSRAYWACVDDGTTSIDIGAVTENLGVDEFSAQGFAWNDKIGFISFYCQGGTNSGLSCGPTGPGTPAATDYGVIIGPETATTRGALGYVKDPAWPASGSLRELRGYAFSDVFGYMNFHCNGGDDGFGNACGGINYGVTMDASDGTLRGCSFTGAGVYVCFDDAVITLPGEEPPAVGDWCDGEPWLCVEVLPDPSGLTFEDADIGTEDGVPIADGEDEYEIHLYARLSDGVTEMIDSGGSPVFDPSIGDTIDTAQLWSSLNFVWTDTVKTVQLAGEPQEKFGIDPTPWPDGGVIEKPVTPGSGGFYRPDPVGEPDHWVWNGSIRSYAPTTQGNKSTTTSFEIPFGVENETFYTDLDFLDGNPIEVNELILRRITFDLEESGGTPVPGQGVIFPNGKQDLHFNFRPAVELNTLYANALEDVIEASRNTAVNFKMGIREIGELEEKVVNAGQIELNLDYAESATLQDCTDNGADPVLFDFHFIKDLFGNLLPTPPETTVKQLPAEDFPMNIGQFLELGEVDVQGIPSLPDSVENPCTYVQGPTFYSVIKLIIDGVNVQYYSNKLPRFDGGLIYNQAVVVEGNARGQTCISPSEEIELECENLNMDTIRSAIDRNVIGLLQGAKVKSGGTCNITSLHKGSAVNNGFEVTGCTSDFYKTFESPSGEETAIYFKGSNVNLDLVGPAWDGNKVVIVDDGNLYIKKDVYDGRESDDRLALVVFNRTPQNYGPRGHVYIEDNVKNIKASIFADGSIYGYSEGLTTINATTSYPEWPGGANQRAETLSCQLVIDGAVASRNTIGGSEIVTSTLPGGGEQTRILFGTGESTTDLGRLEEAQEQDLNFMRLFRLGVQFAGGGPVDQKCQGVLDAEKTVRIFDGEVVCGEKLPCDEGAGSPQLEPNSCDGIDYLPYDPATGVGDLVVVNAECLSQGLNNTGEDADEFDPFYIRFQRPYPDSFIYQQQRQTRQGF